MPDVAPNNTYDTAGCDNNTHRYGWVQLAITIIHIRD